ncbi:MAG: phosphate/phosphite/phosphonate ABC transporter substrate-binding protein [Puniceicoccaceae bacterium]|nr:MAG: phosphate/phosphite/phosphonate ABC transporter substrate-binding protein [Puniceicoccaceae bacterium]
MKPILPLICLLAAGLLMNGCGPDSTYADGTLRTIVIALEPDKDPDAMMEDRRAIEAYLSERVQRPVQAIVPISSAVIYEGLKNGSIDIAYLSSTAAAKLYNDDAIDLLMAEMIDGNPYYESYWIGLKEAPYQSIADLRGQPIAFSSRTSTSGFLIPVWDLYQAGLIDLETGPAGFFGEGQVFYGVGYVSAAERVLNGTVEAAAVSYYVLDKDRHLSQAQRDRLRVIDRQGPVPSHVIVVRKGLHADDVRALQDSLNRMNEEAPKLRDRIFGFELAPAEAATHLKTTLEALELMRTMRF